MTTINDSPITNDSDTELEAFEQRVNEMLSTGELDSALSITDENGVAQVLPMLDTEPIAHLLDGIEELGGSANVFVRTAEGTAILTVNEYSRKTPRLTPQKAKRMPKQTLSPRNNRRGDSKRAGRTHRTMQKRTGNHKR